MKSTQPLHPAASRALNYFNYSSVSSFSPNRELLFHSIYREYILLEAVCLITPPKNAKTQQYAEVAVLSMLMSHLHQQSISAQQQIYRACTLSVSCFFYFVEKEHVCGRSWMHFTFSQAKPKNRIWKGHQQTFQIWTKMLMQMCPEYEAGMHLQRVPAACIISC